MALIRFRPLSPVLDPNLDRADIQTRMSRLFDNFLGQSHGAETERRWSPSVDMYETKNEVVISAELLPGLNEKDIRVSVTGDLLTIQGERQGNTDVKDGGHYRRERWFGKFARTLSLPLPVEIDQVKATDRDGILTVKLPKVEEIKPREIKIDVA